MQFRPHRTKEITGQWLSLLRTDEVGARGATGQQGSATEQGNRPGVVHQEVGQMLRGVPGRCQRLEGEATKLELRAVGEALISRVQQRCARRQDGRTLSGKLAATRDEVGMQMGLQRESNPQLQPLGELEVGIRVPVRIDHEGPAVPQRHEIGRISQPLVDQGNDVHGLTPATRM